MLICISEINLINKKYIKKNLTNLLNCSVCVRSHAHTHYINVIYISKNKIDYLYSIVSKVTSN